MMRRPPEKIEALGEALSRFLHRPNVLALSPEGAWHGPGSWTLAEALRLWSHDRLSPVAIASATRPVLHVAVRLPGRRHYLDAAGLSASEELFRRFRRGSPRDNPFFIPYDPNFFHFSGLPLWPDVAETLAELLARDFGDFEQML
jgi:hypothetical protein